MDIKEIIEALDNLETGIGTLTPAEKVQVLAAEAHTLEYIKVNGPVAMIGMLGGMLKGFQIIAEQELKNSDMVN